MLVPHTGQVPLVAGFLFFMIVGVGFLISLLALHFTQYACIQLTSSAASSLHTRITSSLGDESGTKSVHQAQNDLSAQLFYV